MPGDGSPELAQCDRLRPTGNGLLRWESEVARTTRSEAIMIPGDGPAELSLRSVTAAPPAIPGDGSLRSVTAAPPETHMKWTCTYVRNPRWPGFETSESLGRITDRAGQIRPCGKTV